MIVTKNEEKYMWMSLVVVIIGTFMAVLDSSIVNIAIPKMMTVFNASTDEIQWVLTGYMLTMGIVIPFTGYLSERFGSKTIYIFALIVFTVGSTLCGLANSTNTMIVARVIQAIGDGIIMPVGMAMILQVIPLEKRGLALGIYGISVLAAPAIGPTLSGYIVEYFNWRLIFTINIPIGVIAVTLGVLLLKETERRAPKSFDLFGGITAAFGLSNLLLGLNKVSSKGWTDPYVIGMLVVGFISMTIFVLIELKHQEPLLDLRTLKSFQFSLSLVIAIITQVAMMGAMFLMPIIMESLKGYSAMQTGMMMLPQAMVTGIMMPISGKLFDKYGAKEISIIGLTILAFFTYLLSRISLDTSATNIMLIMAFRGFGVGLCMMPSQTLGLNTIPQALLAKASALSNVVRQVAGSLGIAILTTVLQNRQSFHTAKFMENINMASPNLVKAKSAIQTTVLQHDMKQAAMVAMNDTFLVITLISILGIFCAVFIEKKHRIKNMETTV